MAVARGDTSIYICDTAFIHGDEAIAEALIHEFTHSIGYNSGPLSECAATEVEFSAFIASGRAPYGNDYSRDHQECTPMTEAMSDLAAEIWPLSDQATSIKPGAKVSFSPSIRIELQKQMPVDGTYLLLSGPSDQMFELDAPLGKNIVPQEPLQVKANKSKGNNLDLILLDANGIQFQLSAMGASQISLPISAWSKFGIEIAR